MSGNSNMRNPLQQRYWRFKRSLQMEPLFLSANKLVYQNTRNEFSKRASFIYIQFLEQRYQSKMNVWNSLKIVILVDLKQTGPKNWFLKEIQSPILKWIINQCLPQKCQKKHYERSYNIVEEFEAIFSFFWTV